MSEGVLNGNKKLSNDRRLLGCRGNRDGRTFTDACGDACNVPDGVMIFPEEVEVTLKDLDVKCVCKGEVDEEEDESLVDAEVH